MLLSSLNHGGFYENRRIYKARWPGKYAELNAALRGTVSTWACWCVLGDSVTPEQPPVMEGKGALSLSLAVLPSSLIPVAINTISPSFSRSLTLAFDLTLSGTGWRATVVFYLFPRLLSDCLLPILLLLISAFIIYTTWSSHDLLSAHEVPGLS